MYCAGLVGGSCFLFGVLSAIVTPHTVFTSYEHKSFPYGSLVVLLLITTPVYVVFVITVVVVVVVVVVRAIVKHVLIRFQVHTYHIDLFMSFQFWRVAP